MSENIIEQNPKVSFIISSYNYANFIEQTLNSIKNQTYKNIELIIVDDFSKDNSAEIINKFIENNLELDIKFIKHEKNYGQLKSILTGLSNAQGEFVCFIDSDDIIFEQYTQALLELHSKINVAFISCKNIELNESEQNTTQKKQTKNIKYKYINKNLFGGWFWYPMTSAMFKKESLELLLNYKNTNDWIICPDKFIFNIMNLFEGSVVLNTVLFGKRKHKNNAGNANRTKLNIENNKKIRRLAIEFIKENNSKIIEKYGKYNYKKFIAQIYISYLYVPFQILKYVTKKFMLKI